MHEHVTWEMVENWIKEREPEPHRSGEMGSSIIEVEKGMIGLKHPKTGLVQFMNPKDLGIEKLSPEAEIISHKKDDGHYLVYLINPGSDKLVLLELIMEKKAFGIYPKNFELEEELSEENYAILDDETAAICTSRVLFVVRGERHIGITLEKAGMGKIKNPVFGTGESENHLWLAVMEKGGSEVLLVCLTDKDLGYAVRKKEDGFRGKKPLD